MSVAKTESPDASSTRLPELEGTSCRRCEATFFLGRDACPRCGGAVQRVRLPDTGRVVVHTRAGDAVIAEIRLDNGVPVWGRLIGDMAPEAGRRVHRVGGGLLRFAPDD